mmetsp:Transcript_19582/g.46757  ORF Transcript_19582/g.46757 Transcript_19582/m.46757 type:complete len:189 (-) Transcript_19582:1082-1648(-)
MADYYDCDAIFSEETLIPTMFRTGARGVGRALDPSNDQADLQQGSKVEIPFWMVRSLAERSMVEVQLPKCYNKRIRDKVQAGAEFVDLRTACPYFYEFGMKLNNLVLEEGLPDFLVNTFRVRYAELLTQCQSHDPRNCDQQHVKMRARLTVEEQQVFDAGCEGMAQLDGWRYSLSAAAGRKRKLHVGA